MTMTLRLRPYISRHGKSAESGNPRQSHAHFGHPFAIVLPVTDCVDDLEVALQGDDNKTDNPGVPAKDHDLPIERWPYAVDSWIISYQGPSTSRV